MGAKPLLIVGTSAPHRRRFVMAAFGDRFELHCISPEIDEKQLRSNDATELTRGIANAKMDAVLALLEKDFPELSACARQRSGSFAVTFDQVVVWEGAIREKPEDAAQAKRFISDYSDSRLATVQNTCVYSFATEQRVFCGNHTMTYYRELPEDLIDRVVARGECLHTAGAFVVEDAEMQKHMIKIDPGTEVEVQGVSEDAILDGMQRLMSLNTVQACDV